MTPDELGIVAKLAEIGRRELERRDGVRDPALRDLLARFELEARAARFGEPTMLASVTYLDDWRPEEDTRVSSSVWRRCEECDRSTDKLRRGLCNACRMRRSRAQRRHTRIMGA